MMTGYNDERQKSTGPGHARLHGCGKGGVAGREQGSLTSDLLELNFTFFFLPYRCMPFHSYALSKSHSWKPFLFCFLEPLGT